MFHRRLKRNKLGLRSHEDNEYFRDHEYDIDSLLEFINILRETAGVDTKIKTDAAQRKQLIENFIDDFNYLNEGEGKRELAELIQKTLGETQNQEDPKIKAAGIQKILLMLEFLDALILASSAMSGSYGSKTKNLFLKERLSHGDQALIKANLDALLKTLTWVIRTAFLSYGESIDKLLEKIGDHALIKNNITQKSKIILMIKEASRV